MIQYFAAWYVARRVINTVMKLMIIALLIRVGVYWSQHNTLPPFSLLVDDATTAWTWLESTGAVQWVIKNVGQMIGENR